jgi:hypothetical protein
MAFNGSGTFNRIYNWVNDKANGFKITASRMDGEFDGIATGLSQCITKDGQTTITASIPFNNNKITGLGNGTARTDVINVGQVQDNQFQYLGTTGGTADAYTLTPSPSITAYATTQQITAKINATNLTTTPYLQVSGIANPASTAVIKKLSATKAEIAVGIGELIANGIYTFQRNSANDAWILLTQNIASSKTPTITKYTSGSGTHTTSAGTLYTKVRMASGGGGGGGSGLTGGTGGAGGSSTFGTSLLTANGGIGGLFNAQGSAGGSPTVSSPAISILDIAGSNGGTAEQARAFAYGGAGGSNPISGVAPMSNGIAGLSGKLGGGGAGGGAGATAIITGSGGGAGAYIEALISSPSATYTYAVGSGGAGGTAGTSGFAGGAGGNGYIEITEYYN